jgi:hypothetical protein
MGDCSTFGGRSTAKAERVYFVFVEAELVKGGGS